VQERESPADQCHAVCICFHYCLPASKHFFVLHGVRWPFFDCEPLLSHGVPPPLNGLFHPFFGMTLRQELYKAMTFC